MTTIGPASYFPTTQRTSGAERLTPNARLFDQAAEDAAHLNDEQSSRLADLQAQSDALQKQQLRMSNTEYLTAKFGIEEQIATLRLDAGENLDRYAIRVEDRVFNLAGKMYRLDDILKGADLSDSKIPMAKLVTPDDNPLFSRSQSYVTPRRGVDISA